MIKPHSTVTLHVGKGSPTSTHYYWGNTTPRFPNADTSGSYGSGAYLFDPDGDLRAHATYPCLYACTDVRATQITMHVNYDAPGDDMTFPNGEYVALSLKPTVKSPVDLSYTVLSIHGNVRELGGGTFVRQASRCSPTLAKGPTPAYGSTGEGPQPSFPTLAGYSSCAPPRARASHVRGSGARAPAESAHRPSGAAGRRSPTAGCRVASSQLPASSRQRLTNRVMRVVRTLVESAGRNRTLTSRMF